MNNEQEKLNTSPDEVARLEAEFTAKRKLRLRRTRITRAAVISVLAIILVVIVYFAVRYRDMLSPESLRNYVNISSGSSINTLGGAADVVGGNSSVYAAFSDGLAVATTTSVRYATPNGRNGFSEKAVFTSPALYSSEDYLLAYDKSGITLMLFDKNGLVATAETSGSIISATVSEDGVCSVISEADGYISCLSVFNRKLEPLYRWFNSEYYTIAAAYHDDSRRCAVSAVTESNGTLRGSLLIFDITREGIVNTADLGSAVPTEITTSKYGFTVAARDGAVFAQTDGQIYATQSFSEPVHGICPDGNGGLFFVLAPYTPEEKFILVHCNNEGLLSRKIKINEDILAIHAFEKHFGVMSGKDITVYSTDLDIERIIQREPDVSSVAVIRDGYAVLFSDDGLAIK
ncbi:MAG: hypothetical protein II350_07040 [Clostridia bacterium]|nr:hypothetical protein [Clostridia bacterium]